VALLDDIRPPRRGSRARVLYLDGEPWRTTSIEIVRALDLRVGLITDPADLEHAIGAEEPARARERALRLLAFRDRACDELRTRLAQEGYPPPVAAAVVADLARVGLLDDARFAASMARVLVDVRGYGRARVLRELEARGVDPSVATEATAEALPEQVEAESALRLARKGFRPALALSAARQALDDAGRDESPDLQFPDD
jgi:SOS response regulatory protein OraA/RecX